MPREISLESTDPIWLSNPEKSIPAGEQNVFRFSRRKSGKIIVERSTADGLSREMIDTSQTLLHLPHKASSPETIDQTVRFSNPLDNEDWNNLTTSHLNLNPDTTCRDLYPPSTEMVRSLVKQPSVSPYRQKGVQRLYDGKQLQADSCQSVHIIDTFTESRVTFNPKKVISIFQLQDGEKSSIVVCRLNENGEIDFLDFSAEDHYEQLDYSSRGL